MSTSYRSTIYAEATNTGTQCNPHGIDNILNKRDDQQGQRSPLDTTEKLAQLSDVEINSRIAEENLSISSLPDVNARIREGNISLSSLPDATVLEDSKRQQVQASCWPGFQGMITNTPLWRDRAFLQGEITFSSVFIVLYFVLCTVQQMR